MTVLLYLARKQIVWALAQRLEAAIIVREDAQVIVEILGVVDRAQVMAWPRKIG